MTRKRPLLTMLTVMLGIIAWAAPRTAEQARKIAAEQARKLGIAIQAPQLLEKASPRRTAARATDNSDDQQSYYYVFNNGDDRGFTIVSGDDLMPEIVGYADNGSFSQDNMPDKLRAFLDAYRATLDKVAQGNNDATINVEQLKAMRAAADGQKAEGVAPLLGGIKWSQGEPYNNECPLYYGQNRSVTGCSATAQAMIMRYHKWPESLANDIPSYKSGGVTVEGVTAGEGRHYDWDNMAECYGYDGETGENHAYTETQADAVARLLADVGKSLETQYGPESGASDDMPYYSLTKYFDYDPDIIQYINRTSTSLAQWIDILKKELDEARPVFYAGQSNGGGHAFVCDGYDSDNYFHINWGWGGYSNGYYDITVLNPNNTTSIGASSTDDGYDMDTRIIIGIRPNNNQADAKQWELPSFRVFYGTNSSEPDTRHSIVKATRANASGKFSVRTGWELFNLCTEPFTGDIAVAIVQDDGDIKVIKEQKGLKDIKLFQGWRVQDLKDYCGDFMLIDYAFPVGKTRLAMVEKRKGSDQWTLMQGAMQYSILLDATETDLKFSGDDYLKIDINKHEVQAGNGTIDIKVTNDTPIDYYGRLHVLSSIFFDEKDWEEEVAYIPISLDHGKEMSISVPLKAYELYRCLYISVRDDNDELLAIENVDVMPNEKPYFVLDGYTLEGKTAEELTETTTGTTYWGDMDMPLIHNTGAPEVTVNIKNVGAKGRFYAKVYNIDSGIYGPVDWNSYIVIDEEIDTNQTKTFTIPSGKSGEGLNTWVLAESSRDNDYNYYDLDLTKVEFGIPVNNGQYYFLFAYNDAQDTAIELPAMSADDNHRIYTIDGRRVNDTRKRGILIIGNKKIMFPVK